MRTFRTSVLLAGLAASLVASVARAAPAQTEDANGEAEVTVHGKRLPSRDAGADRIDAQQARAVPGTFGEPLQAVQTLPGVVPMASGLPFFYVRGAPPADTAYFIDGIPLPALFHIGPGPSVIPAPMLDRFDLYPSSAPARYGRAVGGIIAGELTEPSPVARGEASVRLFDSSALVETPFNDGKSTVLVAGRYGYPDLLLSVFAPSLTIEYGDYTTRLTHALTSHDSISLYALGAYDREEDSSQNLVPVSTQFHRIDIRYDHRWTGGSLRLATTLGYDRTSDIGGIGSGETASEMIGRVRLEVNQRYGDAVRLSAGVDANGVQGRYEITGSTFATSQTSQFGGAYLDVRIRPAPWIELAPGVRVDAYQWPQTSSFAIDPKLTARVGFTPDVTWVSTFAIADQPPTYLFPVPGLEIDPSHGLQRSFQMSEGVEANLPWSLRARVTGFFNAERNMSDFVSDCGTFAEACSVVDRVDGRTYGLEVRVERPLVDRLGGSISYTLSRAERHLGNVDFLSPFDRTHVLSAVAQYDVGRGVSVGLRGLYYTGRPDFPTFSYGPTTTFSAGPGQIAQHRLPPFYRVDARVDKRWNLGLGRWITAVAEFFDMTLSQESVDFRCQLLTEHCVAQRIGPVALPSVGLEGGF
jgi:hypothetical protein